MWGMSALLSRGSAVAFLTVTNPSLSLRSGGMLASSSTRSQIMGGISRSSHQYSTTTALSATQFLLTYDYIPDVLEKRGPYREEHISLAKDMIAAGTCLSGGPKGAVNMEVPSGALFIFTTAEAAKAFVEQDPYVSGGIVTGHEIQEWNVVVQKE